MASANHDNANSGANDSRPLRLTLRTLLAWLDDTLPPGEVRQIGNQVTDSQFARDLVERIHKVTRRRRLTVPSSTGADATDPNVVAMYLDNELPAEQVADFEKRCLTSDVHLAEVASCHQILSMLGQKARVPAEARHRMYRLVKGREAIGRATPRALASVPDEETRTPVWGDEAAPSRPWWGRYAVPAGVVALIALMGLSAWRLAPTRRTPQAMPVAMTPPPAQDVRPAVPEPAPTPEPEPEPAPEPQPEPEPAPAPVDAAPAAVATLEPGETVALRYDPAERTWRRLAGGAALAAGDRIAALAPFRTRLRLGELPVELVGPAEVVLRPSEPGGGPTLELAHGRLALRSVPESGATVIAGGTSLTFGPTTAPVGLSLHAGPDDAAGPDPAGLRVFASEGELRLAAAGGASETLDGPATIAVGPDGQFGTGLAEPTPAWVTAAEPPQADQLSGSAFAALFREGVPVSRALVEALEDERPELQALAVSALAATDSIELILPVLTREGAPGLRRTAIDVLRAYRRRGPDAQAALRAQLDQFNGAEWGATVDSLLAPPAAGPANRDTYEALVRLLTNADVGVRELAIERLMALSGRDALGYDPDRPDARAWQQLLREGRLAPAGETNAPAAPAAAPAGGAVPAPGGAAPRAVPRPPAPGLVPPGGNPGAWRGPAGLPRVAGLRYDRGRRVLPPRGQPFGMWPRRR